MNVFRVWTRPLQSTSRVRVDGGAANALWLLKRLSQSFFFKSSQSISVVESGASFEVPFASDLSGAPLRLLLGKIPEVRLMPEPA